ncbi:MAG TPA: UDP-N-acetylmuramate--L-alanine ligase [Clostridia bacterium]|nr:UDP-N-acetylmuramate--L-alanine ligase [Clostridia bacterium]
MKAEFLKGINHVHFIGINGSSMSGLAILLFEKGIKVTGSDIEHTHTMDKLISMGIEVYVPHDSKKMGKPDLVVYTAAVHSDNAEYIFAEKNNIPLMDRALLLGKIMDEFKYSIAISGAHGKTTTTTLTAYLLEQMGFDATIHDGGEAPFLNGNVKSGNSDYFITEACEFNGSFLKLNPYISVILNIDFDHVDWFKTFDNMKKSFLEFANRTDKDGYLVACYDDVPTREVASQVKCNVVYYGLNNTALDYTALDIVIETDGKASYDLYVKDVKVCRVSLGAEGIHNVLNSLAVIAVLDLLGADIHKASSHLSYIHGAKRRFDLQGEADGVKVYSDYAHHPTEIAVTLETASKMKHRKLYAAFEAHTFSRVRVLFNEFAKCFAKADTAIIADIYNDRESADFEVSGMKLAEAILKNGTDSIYLPSYKAIEDYLYEHVQPGDVVMVLGSKYLETICMPLVERLKDRESGN